jgi:hypothetical protein
MIAACRLSSAIPVSTGRLAGAGPPHGWPWSSPWCLAASSFEPSPTAGLRSGRGRCWSGLSTIPSSCWAASPRIASIPRRPRSVLASRPQRSSEHGCGRPGTATTTAPSRARGPFSSAWPDGHSSTGPSLHRPGVSSGCSSSTACRASRSASFPQENSRALQTAPAATSTTCSTPSPEPRSEEASPQWPAPPCSAHPDGRLRYHSRQSGTETQPCGPEVTAYEPLRNGHDLRFLAPASPRASRADPLQARKAGLRKSLPSTRWWAVTSLPEPPSRRSCQRVDEHVDGGSGRRARRWPAAGRRLAAAVQAADQVGQCCGAAGAFAVRCGVGSPLPAWR